VRVIWDGHPCEEWALLTIHVLARPRCVVTVIGIGDPGAIAVGDIEDKWHQCEVRLGWMPLDGWTFLADHIVGGHPEKWQSGGTP
jgi:hypothetical protein